jgi:uncharacterized membrane protein YhaH (DUF805 family)
LANGELRTTVHPLAEAGTLAWCAQTATMQLLAQTSTSSSDATAGAIAAMLGGGFLIFFLIILVVMVAIYYAIVKKTGMSPWLSLLVLVPGLGQLALLLILAFSEWPVQRAARGAGGYPGAGGGYSPPPGAPYPPPGSSITTP